MKKAIKMALLCLLSLALCSCSRNSSANGVRMLARIETLGEKIEVSVLESEYTSGPHLVIISDKTEIYSRSGEKVTRDALSVGDTVNITYSGQVMLSYPPQIVAHSIKVK